LVKLLNENKIASSFSGKSIKIWDIATGYCIKTLSGHSNIVCCISILSNDWKASCPLDKYIRVWDLESGNCIKIIRKSIQTVSLLAQKNHLKN